MRIEYIPENDVHGPQYKLQPENPQEQRFLTILRDHCTHPDVRVRVIGAEHITEQRLGMPANPVVNLGLEIERRDGSKYTAKAADPNLPTPRKEGRTSPVGRGGKTTTILEHPTRRRAEH